MFIFIFISIIIISAAFYYIIGKYYVIEQYELIDTEIGKTTHIRGNYIDLTYKSEKIRINKDSDNNWYLYNFETEEKISLHYNKPFEFGNRNFIITKKIKRGGLFALSPIIIVIVTILSLFQQNNSSINKNETNETEVQYNINEEEKQIDDNKIQDESNGDDANYSTTNNTEKGDLLPNIVEKDMHTIVLENDSDFKYNIAIDWDSYQNAERTRRKLENNPSEMGISVSKYQETIDWQEVKADGIDFAIIQVGSRGYETGSLYIDNRFNENMYGATANDIKIGVCIYSQAITQDEMDEEIEFIIDSINQYTLDYPIGISLERNERCRTIVLSDEEYVDLLKYFCIKIKQNGYTPMIMGDEEWFQEFPEETFRGYLKLVYSPNIAPSNIDNCIIWQYRQNTKGMVNGVNNKLVLSLNLSAYISLENKNAD